MDYTSHELFTRYLLAKAGKNTAYSLWGEAPDLDGNMLLHRYWRHRLTVLPDTHTEFSKKYPTVPSTDLDAVVIGVTSHLYLDIFNGFVIPFEMTNPLWQIPLMFQELLENPYTNILKLSEPDRMPQQFFIDSEQMFDSAFFGSTPEQITMTFLDIIAKRTATPICHATGFITSFTKNTAYSVTQPINISGFETEYCQLILSYLET